MRGVKSGLLIVVPLLGLAALAGAQLRWSAVRAQSSGAIQAAPRLVESSASVRLALISGAAAGPDGAHGPAAIIYRDDFSEPGSGWPSVNDANRTLAYIGGEYLIHEKRAGGIQSVVADLPLEDFAFEVDARAGSATDPSAMGVVVADPGASGQSLAFLVQPMDGYFGLLRLGTGNPSWEVPIRQSSAIRAEGYNRIRIEREGTELRLVVNAELLERVPFAAGTVTGFGLANLNTGRSGTAQAYFDYILLASLDEIPPTIGPTLAPSVTPTLTEGPSPTPRPSATPRPPLTDWALLFRESFDEVGRLFPHETTANPRAFYDNGVYRMIYDAGSGIAFAAFTQISLGDVAIEVEVRAAEGRPVRGYGIAFGDDYRFVVEPDRGLFYLLERRDGSGTLYYVLREQPSAAIRPGSQPNLLRVERKGSSGRLLANGVVLASLDNLRAQSGEFGTFAIPIVPSSLAGEAIFDDFFVEVPTLRPVAAPGAVTPPPRATATAWTAPSPTAPLASATPSRGRHSVALPLVWRGAAVAELPSPFPPPAGRVEIQLGVAVGPDGALVEPGSAWEQGVKTIFARLSYAGVAPGTRLAWRWFFNGRPVEVEALNRESVLEAPSGAIDMGITTVSGLPLPIGSYEVRALLGPQAYPAASVLGRILDSPPPGATARPSPTPAATPTDIPLPRCRELLANPGFEQGPLGWELRTSASADEVGDLGDAIRRGVDFEPPVPAASGEWVARLGGGRSRSDHLLAEPVIELPAAWEIGSATFTYRAAVYAEDDPDNEHDDQLMVMLVNQDDSDAVLLPIALSDESHRSQWSSPSSVDLARLLARRDNWTGARLRVVGMTDEDESSTVFYVDDLRLELCPPNLNAPPAPEFALAEE